MARINIITPRLNASKFTGGMVCLMEFAHGLTKKGHEVQIVPILPSPQIQWFQKPAGKQLTSSLASRCSTLMKTIGLLFKAAWMVVFGKKEDKKSLAASAFNGFIDALLHLIPPLLNMENGWSSSLSYAKQTFPEADIQIASSFETVFPTMLYGKGAKYWFLMHYEPLFKHEYSNPEMAEMMARLALSMDIQFIASSKWLQEQLSAHKPAALCSCAIDHHLFHGEPKLFQNKRRIRIISYGGRTAAWKGFREMALAVQLARAELPDHRIEWQVYGSSLLQPNNDIAPFQSIGFLSQEKLARAYAEADLLLSASWYESFPLYPIEAMASGIPVITTQNGTEAYAITEETAAIVRPQDPRNIADGIKRVITDQAFRNRITIGGTHKSREFTWDKAVDRLEKILQINEVN